MVSDALLQVDAASKSYPGVQALDDVHLDLRRGEVHAVVGENGAGKSTLMKLLSGIDRPDAGEFLLDGEPYTPTSPRHAQELGISIIHQELNLMPDLTVAQNIYIGREPRRGRIFLSDARAQPADPGAARPARAAARARPTWSATSPWPGSRWSRSPRRSASTPGCSSWTSRPRR